MPKDGNYGPRGYGHQKLIARSTGKTKPKMMDYAETDTKPKYKKKGSSGGYKSVAGSPGSKY